MEACQIFKFHGSCPVSSFNHLAILTHVEVNRYICHRNAIRICYMNRKHTGFFQIDYADFLLCRRYCAFVIGYFCFYGKDLFLNAFCKGIGMEEHAVVRTFIYCAVSEINGIFYDCTVIRGVSQIKGVLRSRNHRACTRQYNFRRYVHIMSLQIYRIFTAVSILIFCCYFVGIAFLFISYVCIQPAVIFFIYIAGHTAQILVGTVCCTRGFPVNAVS